jgi:hypothetical protein
VDQHLQDDVQVVVVLDIVHSDEASSVFASMQIDSTHKIRVESCYLGRSEFREYGVLDIGQTGIVIFKAIWQNVRLPGA